MKNLYSIFYIIDHSDQLLHGTMVTSISEIKSEKVFDNILGKMFFKKPSYISGLGDLIPSIMIIFNQ